MFLKRALKLFISLAILSLLALSCTTIIFLEDPKPIVSVSNSNILYCSKMEIEDLAREMNKKLVWNGYIVDEPRNIANYKVVTEIIYNPVDKKPAKELRKVIGVGRLIPLEEMQEGMIQVILGMDSIVSTFPMMKAEYDVEHKILVLNSTDNKDLGEYMTEKIKNLLSRKYTFYSPDFADRYFIETMIYYPPELRKLAKEIRDSIGKGTLEEVKNLKDVIVVLGLEFDPELKKQLGYEKEKPDVRIVVDKTDFRLSVYDLLTGNFLAEYPVAIGNNPDLGDKKRKGDKRTPEGNFKIESIEYIEYSPSWLYESKYEYGPWFLRLGNSRWEGISIIGIYEEGRIGTPASGGCILLYKDDIEELVKMIKIGTVVEIRH